MSNLRFTLYLVLIFLVACRQESSLERALAASGDNRKELELVLDYFRGDSLKYKAACFLIENMPGAFAVDEKIVAACQPFYQMYDSLSHTYDYDSLSIYDQYPSGKDWGRQIDGKRMSIPETILLKLFVITFCLIARKTVCWWIVHARYSTVGITDSFLPIPEKI